SLYTDISEICAPMSTNNVSPFQDSSPLDDRPSAYVSNKKCKTATTANRMYCYQAAF
ncbi:hypothetical protein DPMN_098806, partial [Dreissena polymorpha]